MDATEVAIERVSSAGSATIGRFAAVTAYRNTPVIKVAKSLKALEG